MKDSTDTQAGELDSAEFDAAGVDPAEVIGRYWATCEARDWSAFGALVADDVVYEVPQSRERVCGRGRYVEFNQTFGGDWHVRVERIVGRGRRGASWISFVSADTEQPGDKEQTGLCFFDLDGHGLITHITDFWPEPYEPPPGREHLTERY